ncbi:MAG: two-component system LytT family sensor kinase [Cyclobacteriaceae bacterium]|jgi:sensor histidine kinase YesM
MDTDIIWLSKASLIKKYTLSVIVIPLIGGFFISVFFCLECFTKGDYSDIIENTLLSATFWSVLANGNTYMSKELDKRWVWIRQPVKRFLIGTLALFAYTIVASIIILFVYMEFVRGIDFINGMSRYGWLRAIVPGLLITIFMTIFMHGKGFLFAWRQAAIDVEQLKNKNLSSKYESLKNQVNPHFLFNSLNALSSLVYSNQDGAVEFIRKLADVYRYVLDHQFDEVVELETELKFVDSFIYLNKIRFGESFNVSIEGRKYVSIHDRVPPVAIQMLLENAFKHNVVSKDQKLHVEIVLDSGFVVVSNNINRKISTESPSGVGLNNIRSRYGFLTDVAIEVYQEMGKFVVKMPILKMKEA